jgi:hypothetical protein
VGSNNQYLKFDELTSLISTGILYIRDSHSPCIARDEARSYHHNKLKNKQTSRVVSLIITGLAHMKAANLILIRFIFQ